MEQLLTLQGLLTVLVGLGAGYVAYWLLGKWDWFLALDRFNKRTVGLALSGLIGAGAVAAMLLLGYVAVPGTTVELVEVIYGGFASAAVATFVHGFELK